MNESGLFKAKTDALTKTSDDRGGRGRAIAVHLNSNVHHLPQIALKTPDLSPRNAHSDKNKTRGACTHRETRERDSEIEEKFLSTLGLPAGVISQVISTLADRETRHADTSVLLALFPRHPAPLYFHGVDLEGGPAVLEPEHGSLHGTGENATGDDRR
ncbi:hypothetical protein WN48_00381 [Eufriesea mexicana]|nr:hypothetical protein WN48_00381 [Eufriesea mexicana]